MTPGMIVSGNGGRISVRKREIVRRASYSK